MTEQPLIDRIRWLAAFLDAQNGDDDNEMAMQILQLTEEAGEVAKAWIGHTGQNPRKGMTHSLDDVWAELADVAITAMVGIARLGGDPMAEIDSKVAVVMSRYEALAKTLGASHD